MDDLLELLEIEFLLRELFLPAGLSNEQLDSTIVFDLDAVRLFSSLLCASLLVLLSLLCTLFLLSLLLLLQLLLLQFLQLFLLEGLVLRSEATLQLLVDVLS